MIVRLSRGLPHYTHLLGLHTSLQAIKRDQIHVIVGDIDTAILDAVNKSRSMLSAYDTATTSPQKQNIYRYRFTNPLMQPFIILQGLPQKSSPKISRG